MSVARRRRASLRLAAVAGTVIVLAAAAPAWAQQSGGVSAQIDDLVIGAVGAPGKALPMYVGAWDATNPKVAIDVSGLAGVATVEFPDTCSTSGSTTTCPVPLDDDSGIATYLPLHFRPAPGAAVGDKGTLTYTTSADDVDPYEQQTTVTVADGVDLVALVHDEIDSAKIGETITTRVVTYNAGNRAGDGIRALFFVSSGLTPASYQDCVYANDGSGGTIVACEFDGVFEPDQKYELTGGFQATVRPHAMGFESLDHTLEPLGIASELPDGLTFTSRGGKALKWAPAKSMTTAERVEIDNRDNWGSYYINKVPNTFDVAAVGAAVKGTVGQIVPVRIGVKNNGPGALDSTRSQEPVASFALTVPAGAEVVSVPRETCELILDNGDGSVRPVPAEPGGDYYYCRDPRTFLGVGESFLVEFGLKITSLDAAAGEVSRFATRMGEDPRKDDANHANDTAPVTVAGSGGAGGGLPVTGVQTGAIIGGGAVLLAAGAVLFVVSRRRRVVLVAGEDGR